MKSYELIETGQLGDEQIPAFKFEVEMREGEDLDGKFHIQFAAVEQEGERRFALNSPQGLLAVFNREDSVELAERLSDAGEYIVLANYENRAWDEPAMGAVSMPLMGREFGDDVDYRERYELPPEEYEAVEEIHSLLTDDAPAP